MAAEAKSNSLVLKDNSVGMGVANKKRRSESDVL
jgi:hypothetical protein